MSLLRSFSQFVFGSTPTETSARGSNRRDENAAFRQCRIERLEDRRVLSANPVVAGVTFFETDNGADLIPDYFEVTFQGGSETTRLTGFTIDGDQDRSGGRSLGDIIFHSAPNIAGAGDYHAFKFDSINSKGIVESDIVSWKVSNDGLLLDVQLKNFEAGDVLAFTIDVDEIEKLRPDKIVSGTEMETSLFQATFVDAHYTMERITGVGAAGETSGMFWDYYDDFMNVANQLAKQNLELKADNAGGHMDRTAAAWDGYNLIEKPVSISGRVFHDNNINCLQDGTEMGIAGVKLTLERLNSNGQYEQVANTTTDSQGDYKFGVDLGLKPGTYRVIETQPDGYLSVGAMPGTVAGNKTGSIHTIADSQPNILAGIIIPKGDMHAINYDFCEVMPVQLSGYVFHDRNDNGMMESGEEGISDVQILVRRTGGLQTTDIFANWNNIIVTTDSNGFYSVMGLPPGVYEIIEINQYPGQKNPLVDFLDGKDMVGTVNGTTRGTTGQDHHTQVLLHAGDASLNNNFGELKPVSLSGYVSQADRNGNCTKPGDANYMGIQGVTIELYNSRGQMVSTTKTKTDGTFEFTGLFPGSYSIKQIQPAGFLDGADHVGTVNGANQGTVSANDMISQINLMSGQSGIRYGFCEHLPANVSGRVFHDRNDNGVIDSGEEGISGVTIRLLNADGRPVMIDNGGTQMVLVAITDTNGNYKFENLRAGEYQIQQIQPNGWVDGKDSVGSLGGLTSNDLFTKIMVRDGDAGVRYDFGEFKLSSISGYVHVDSDGNCTPDSAGDLPIANVSMQLLDQNGNVVKTTMTNKDGFYEFKELLPGTYSVRQTQPTEYFTGGQKVGYLMGHPDVKPGTAAENLISNIMLKSNFNVVQYNFCEVAGAAISGKVFQDGPAFKTQDGLVPANYRSLRDGQFTSDDKPIGAVRMALYWYIDPKSQEIAPRPVMLSEVLGQHYSHMSGANSPVYVMTDSQGNYKFDGLAAGNYIVLQSQPVGYVDANNYVGTTTGLAFNSFETASTAPQSLLSTFSQQQLMDTLANIRVNNGQVSMQNNFTEVLVSQLPPPTPDLPNIPQLPPVNGHSPGPGVPLTGFGGLLGHQGINSNVFVGIGFSATMPTNPPVVYSWHLSLINDGTPREAQGNGSAPWHEVGYLSELDWNRFDMEQGQWTFTTEGANGSYKKANIASTFGTLGGKPLVGDFNGDGLDQIAIFKDGYWFIDSNGNGTWDKDDLMIRLGNEDDQPVVGDWDGDGKADIAIFGPQWQGDEYAISREPGLPDRENHRYTRPKNIPPVIEEAVEGSRVLKQGVVGRNRADVIDHVFSFGQEGDIAISGDFNGDGITQIGVFNNGAWTIDSNGDGRLDIRDQRFQFGQSGDIPVVGDFDGDGISDLAVYRDGRWYIDTNGNRQLDAADRVFEMKGEGYPVAGDFNGDGKDTPVLYQTTSPTYRQAN
ncbi:MAG: SdrD B-like domain-containing protein [Pirellulaceae bacterium]|nr:SdrD B-like domain-containing protein [Pirellulaceae bacterium]